MRVHGNTTGLSASVIKSLERLYRRRVPFDGLTTPELTRSLADVSHTTGRQVGVLVDRAGQVDHVIVGDAHKLFLPDVGRLRAAAGRLRGLRLIHTHLANQPLSRDDLVDLTRLRLDLVAAICLNPADGRPMWVYYGHNVPVRDGADEAPFHTVGPVPYSRLDVNPAELVLALEAEFARAARARPAAAPDGRAMLVHVGEKSAGGVAEESMRELRELARTAGVEVADEVVQMRNRVDPKYVLGRGKLEDVVIRAMQLDAEVLIFDRDLRPGQAAAIASLTDLKVLDRTQLILDIFAQHAHTRDGKLQVELAQMKYLLPRLGQKDDALSRLSGGIGGRGPGETKLEIGRRRARDRVTRLQTQLKKLSKQRKQRRSHRTRRGARVVSLVGYTNAGKSTLMNALTGSDVLVEDKLFATLDTRSRRMHMPNGEDIVISDTVGFIRELPKDLFAAFRATFEEAADSDLLVQVIDASDPARDEHQRATESLIVELGLEQIPRIDVYNKADAAGWEVARMCAASSRGVAVSALEAPSLKPLVERIQESLSRGAFANLAAVDIDASDAVSNA